MYRYFLRKNDFSKKKGKLGLSRTLILNELFLSYLHCCSYNFNENERFGVISELKFNLICCHFQEHPFSGRK